MSEVRTILISDVCDLNLQSMANFDAHNCIEYLDTGSITRNVIAATQILHPNFDEIPSRAKRKIKHGSIIYSTVRPNQEHFGYFDHPPVNLIVSTGFTTLDVKDSNLDSKFLYYLLTQKYITDYLHKIGENSVSAYPSINPADLGNLRFRIPKDKSQQNNIATVLSALDAKISCNNRINAELEAMAKTLYDYWFVQFDFPDANGNPYKSSGGKMVYNAILKREIPEGWKDGTLDDLGQIVGGSTPTTENPDNFSADGTPWITPYDLSGNQGNKFITRGTQDVSDEGIKAASLKKYPAGTVLLSSRAPIGYMAIARGPLTTNQGFKSFIPTYGYSTAFIYYTVKSSLKTITQYSSGSTFKEISGAVLKTVKVCLPKSGVVEQFTNTVEPILKRQDLLEQENQHLTQLRDWLLPMLMNGQVTVV